MGIKPVSSSVPEMEVVAVYLPPIALLEDQEIKVVEAVVKPVKDLKGLKVVRTYHRKTLIEATYRHNRTFSLLLSNYIQRIVDSPSNHFGK